MHSQDARLEVGYACSKSLFANIIQTLSQGCSGAGPFQLDLGDVLYAPTVFQDAKGRCIMLAWLQELRPDGHHPVDYAGCMSLPRVLTLKGQPQALLWASHMPQSHTTATYC